MSDRRFAGIDWASEEHAVCVVDERGRIVEGRRYRHDEPGIRALCSRPAQGLASRQRASVLVPDTSTLRTRAKTPFGQIGAAPSQLSGRRAERSCNSQAGLPVCRVRREVARIERSTLVWRLGR